MKKILLTALSVAILAGCASADKKVAEDMEGMKYPAWVLNPQVEGGIAVAECVLASGNFSIDKQQAVANATASLAQRLDVKVKAMTESLSKKTTANVGVNSSSEFTAKARTITERTMVGVTPQKFDFAEFDNQRHFCALVSIDKASTDRLFNQLLDNWSRPVTPDNKQQVYRDFLLAKAEDDLSKK